ncbi:MAG: hypothetical protein FJ006_03710 [Chloroflexi bacterium]|nr:hypothetical protein [Chloroflexota bacterium]
MAKGKGKVLGMVGFWAFIVGLIIAVVVGIMAALGAATAIMPAVIIILIILGLIIGFLNITAKELLLFLVAIIALMVVGGVFAPLKMFGIGAMLDAILALVATLMAPAAIVVAIKALWAVGKPGD